MLIISRKKDESILVGDNVKITVIETGDGRVKIGVDAPREVRVIRAEIAQMGEFNRSATSSKLSAEVLAKLKAQSGKLDKI
ncbi:MAG: carbon storage regulator [Ruminococcus sp.]|jgi:carbon storage regulator|nr:carbon storage regulator [Ruminococcus sp.]